MSTLAVNSGSHGKGEKEQNSWQSRGMGILIVLGFKDTSTLVGHFVSSPREREKRDRRNCRRDEREGQVRKTNKNESKETEEIKHSPSTLTCYKGNRPCPIVSQYQLDAPVT